MELTAYFQLFRRWWWLLVMGVILGGGVAYFASSRQTPVYEAATKVLVLQGPQVLPAQGDTVVDLSSLTGREVLPTYIELLETRPIMDLAGERINHPISAGQISTEQLNSTNIIRLRVLDDDPEMAALIANTLVEILIEQNDELQASRYADSEQNLQAQLDQMEQQISGVQAEISQILDEENALDEPTRQILAARLDNLETRLANLETAAQSTSAQLELLNAELVGITSEELGNLDAQFDPISPEDLLNLRQEITNLSREFDLPETQPGFSGQVSDPRLTQLQSSLTIYQQIYTELLSNFENIRLARTRDTPSVVQVETALAPSSPISPQPVRNALMGAAFGLILAGGIAFLIEYMDDTLKTPDDVQQVLGVPVMGVIPRMQVSKKGEPHVQILEQPHSAASESIRMLRANVDFARQHEDIQSILIASDSPKAGKTTLAVNLAVSLARDGRQVVLVDADLRRPAVHKYLAITNRVGLRDILNGTVDIQEAALGWREVQGLRVITSGWVPSNPTETLNAQMMAEVIRQMEEMSDVVILDSPPLMVAESTVLSSLVDGVIWVIEPGKTRVRTAQSAQELLARADSHVIGVVLNQIKARYSQYYKGYYQYLSVEEPSPPAGSDGRGEKGLTPHNVDGSDGRKRSGWLHRRKSGGTTRSGSR